MAKTEFLQIRLTPESRQRLSRVAEADHLNESTWARRAILQALEEWEADRARHGLAAEAVHAADQARRRVAESKPASQGRVKSTSTSRPKSAAKKPSK
jgi:predicted transcriptional regulator